MTPEPLNILVPMAGRGSRFSNVGYTQPKPLIPVHGRPMIEIVIRNLAPARPHRFVFLCLGEHLAGSDLRATFERLTPNSVVVPVDTVTQGAACTALLAREHIDSSAPLMIANCDQYVDLDIDEYLAAGDRAHADGFIMTFSASDPKWSYCKLDEQGRVQLVVEKQVISNEATVGIYNFARGADFVRAADRMISRERRVNGEFYVAPVYNELIEDGARITTHNIGPEAAHMYGLGTPADLEAFLKIPLAKLRLARLL